jgi:hypothetical protein
MSGSPRIPIPQTLLVGAALVRPRIFISYHHSGDQYYYNQLSNTLAHKYVLASDRSLNRVIDSDDADYVMRKIREEYLTGTSCTVVLCGARTAYSKFVDWEINATLQKKHALVGLWLPTLVQGPNGGTNKPARLQDNINSGYAVWGRYIDVVENPQHLVDLIHAARLKPKSLIVNNRARRLRNG